MELIRKVENLDLKAIPLLQKQTFLMEGIRSKLGTAIKVVVVKKKDRILVWTNFPTGKKKGKRK